MDGPSRVGPPLVEDLSVAASGSDIRGIALIATITVAVMGWLYSQRPEGGAPSAPMRAAELPDLPGFRADAWFLPDDDLLGFVEIPAGPFPMGSDPKVDLRAYDNEQWSPSSEQGTVDVSLFYIGRYEVTAAQFRAFVEATEFRVVDAEALGVTPLDHPVVSVSWPEALAYCRWLEATLSESPNTPPSLRRLLSDGWRVTLPSEAQWEKAARGTDGRVFPWGDEPGPGRANYEGSSAMRVGSFTCPECPFGLSDMSGNVWELTRSPYRAYPYDPSLDGLDLDADALWVMRGGSYGDPDQNIRAATRGGADPGARRPVIGFRVVLTRSDS